MVINPHDQALNSLFPNVKSVENNNNVVDQTCTHYLFGKMLNLSFPNSHFIDFSPFELVHSYCGVLHLLLLSVGLDITFCLLIIILDLVGFIY